MMALQNLKLIYSSVPRTGTLSMMIMLKQHYGGVHIPKCHRHMIPTEYQTFHRFMIIRNPYTRLLSWWRWWKDHDSRIPQRPNETFREFLIWINQNKHMHTGKYYYSYDNQTNFGIAFGANTYLFLENLPADFRKIHALRGADQYWENVPAHMYMGRQRPLDKFYGSEELELVESHSGLDFERFGYARI